jgi:hypothetical protein
MVNRNKLTIKIVYIYYTNDKFIKKLKKIVKK